MTLSDANLKDLIVIKNLIDKNIASLNAGTFMRGPAWHERVAKGETDEALRKDCLDNLERNLRLVNEAITKKS